MRRILPRSPQQTAPAAWLARTGSQSYLKTKTKGDRIAMAGLHQPAFIPWGWHVAPDPSPTPKKKLSFVGKKEGEWSSHHESALWLWWSPEWVPCLSFYDPKNNLDSQECQGTQSPRRFIAWTRISVPDTNFLCLSIIHSPIFGHSTRYLFRELPLPHFHFL